MDKSSISYLLTRLSVPVRSTASSEAVQLVQDLRIRSGSRLEEFIHVSRGGEVRNTEWQILAAQRERGRRASPTIREYLLDPIEAGRNWVPICVDDFGNLVVVCNMEQSALYGAAAIMDGTALEPEALLASSIDHVLRLLGRWHVTGEPEDPIADRRLTLDADPAVGDLQGLPLYWDE